MIHGCLLFFHAANPDNNKKRRESDPAEPARGPTRAKQTFGKLLNFIVVFPLAVNENSVSAGLNIGLAALESLLKRPPGNERLN
jgi:hypothetical protein